MSPRDILDMQAMALRELTGGLLTAQVNLKHDHAEGAVYLIFDLVVPKLQGKRHRILTGRYLDDRIYPCHVDADGLRSSEVAHSDEEFRELVRQVLHSGEVKSLALSLIATAKEELPKERVIARHHNGHNRLFRPAWNGVETDEDSNGSVEALYDEAQGID